MHQDASHEYIVFNYIFNMGLKDEISSGNFLTWDEKKIIKKFLQENMVVMIRQDFIIILIGMVLILVTLLNHHYKSWQ